MIEGKNRSQRAGMTYAANIVGMVNAKRADPLVLQLLVALVDELGLLDARVPDEGYMRARMEQSRVVVQAERYADQAQASNGNS